jgi:hypothetical protein
LFTLSKTPVPARSGPVHVTFNCQTACDDRFKAGPLRGDPASPRVPEGTGGAGHSGSGVAEPFPVLLTFPKSPVPARSGARSCTSNCQTPCDDRFKAGPLRGDRPAPGFLRGRVGPGLSGTGVAGALSGTAQSSKRFVTCPVRCLVYRSIVKRHAMIGSRLDRYAETGQPPGYRGDGAGPGLPVPARPGAA